MKTSRFCRFVTVSWPAPWTELRFDQEDSQRRGALGPAPLSFEGPGQSVQCFAESFVLEAGGGFRQMLDGSGIWGGPGPGPHGWGLSAFRADLDLKGFEFRKVLLLEGKDQLRRQESGA